MSHTDEDSEQLKLLHTADGKANGTRTLEKCGSFFLNMYLPYNQAIPLLGTHPVKRKTHVHAKTCTPMFIVAILLLPQLGKSQMPFSLWVDETVVREYSGILLSDKWNNQHAAARRNLKCTMGSKRSQTRMLCAVCHIFFQRRQNYRNREQIWGR